MPGQHPAATIDNRAGQRQRARIVDLPGQTLIQQGMINRGEMLDNIQPQGISVRTRQLLHTPDSFMSAFAHPIGIAVRIETGLENRFDHLTQGMMHNPIAKRRSADQTPLGFVDVKAFVVARLIRTAGQILLQGKQTVSQLMFESGCCTFTTLATRCRTPGRQQIGPGNDPFESAARRR